MRYKREIVVQSENNKFLPCPVCGCKIVSYSKDFYNLMIYFYCEQCNYSCTVDYDHAADLINRTDWAFPYDRLWNFCCVNYISKSLSENKIIPSEYYRL
jgi:transcription elongation factor Elf1